MTERTRGRAADACPNCGSTTTNVQGIPACPDCRWVRRPDE